MRLPVRLWLLFAAVAATALPAAIYAQDQNAGAQSVPQAPVPANGGYVPVNPLSGVRYDNRFDMSLGLAYDHMKAGPTLLQGSNLGGLNLSGSMWLTRHWGLEGSGRAYVGTSGAGLNSAGGAPGGALKGPMVKQYFFVGGPEWLGPHNQHGDLMAHLLLGGVYGDFQKDLLGVEPAVYDFYHDQVAPAGIIGGDFDLNRSARWVFRIEPDAVMTHYNFREAPPYFVQSLSYDQFDVNFAISVGLEYKFNGRRSNQKGNWTHGW